MEKASKQTENDETGGKGALIFLLAVIGITLLMGIAKMLGLI